MGKKFVLLQIIVSASMLLVSCSLSGYGAAGGKVAHGVYHRVRSGETLAGIGQRFGVGAGELALLNGITSMDSLDSGQLLLVRYDRSSYGSSSGDRGTTPVSYRGYGSYADSAYDEEDITSRSSSTREQSDDSFGREIAYGRGWDREATENQASSFRGRLSWPVAGGQIVSGFGRRPGTYHDGIDIMADEGTPIFAANNGQVIYADDEIPGYGNMIVLRGSDGMTTVYAHCRRLLAKEGDRVRSGQKIAEVGQTGKATGPHLHFEVRRRTVDNKFVAVDPIPFFAQSAPQAREREQANLNGLLHPQGG